MRITKVSLALFLFLNLLFYALASTDPANCDTPSKQHSSKHKHKHKHNKHMPKSHSPPTPFITPKPPSFPLPFLSPPIPKSPTLPPRFPPSNSPPFPFPRTPGFPLPSTSPPFPFPFPRTPVLPPSFPLPPGFPLPFTSPPYPSPKTPKQDTCPKDSLKFEACSRVLGRVVGGGVGTPPKKPCCSIFGGLVEWEAAVCLCTAIKANVLGFNLNVPVSMSLVLNVCDIKAPPGFQCA